MHDYAFQSNDNLYLYKLYHSAFQSVDVGVPHEGYSRNASYALTLVSMCLSHGIFYDDYNNPVYIWNFR